MKKILYFVIARRGRYDPFHSTISSCTFITIIQTHKWILLGLGSGWIEHRPACSFAHYLLLEFNFLFSPDHWTTELLYHLEPPDKSIDISYDMHGFQYPLKLPSSKHHTHPYDFELLTFRVYWSSSNTMSKFAKNVRLYIWDLPETRDNLAGTMQVQARAG